MCDATEDDHRFSARKQKPHFLSPTKKRDRLQREAKPQYFVDSSNFQSLKVPFRGI